MAQTLEVLEHHDPTGEEIVYRYPQSGSAEIKLGAQLVVHEAQEAVLYRDGKALDVFGPGRHTLSTQNIPVAHQIAFVAVRRHIAVPGGGGLRQQTHLHRPEVGHPRTGGLS